MELRERGIYALPNGRRLVVRSRESNGLTLFHLNGWEHFESSYYEINERGRLTAQGRLTAWDVKDLQDTGQSADN